MPQADAPYAAGRNGRNESKRNGHMDFCADQLAMWPFLVERARPAHLLLTLLLGLMDGITRAVNFLGCCCCCLAMAALIVGCL